MPTNVAKLYARLHETTPTNVAKLYARLHETTPTNVAKLYARLHETTPTNYQLTTKPPYTSAAPSSYLYGTIVKAQNQSRLTNHITGNIRYWYLCTNIS